MKKILLSILSLLISACLYAQDWETFYMYAYDKTGGENNYIELSTNDGDMYSATGATFTNSSSDLNGIHVTTAEWSTIYCPMGWPEIKIGEVFTFQEGGTEGGWIYGWTLAESNYIYFQKSTGKFVISASSENPILGDEPVVSEYESLSLYAYDITHSANVNIPLTTKDGIEYTAIGYAFPAEVTDGFKGVQIHNDDWSKIYAPAAETYPSIQLNEKCVFELGGTGEAWISGWIPSAEDTFSFNVESGEFVITGLASVSDITTSNTETNPVYYNMSGIEVANPQSGLFIKRQGDTFTKVIIR